MTYQASIWPQNWPERSLSLRQWQKVQKMPRPSWGITLNIASQMSREMSDKVDKTIERKLYFHEADEPPDNCPQCGRRLVQENGPYQIATRSGRRLTDQFVISGDFGYLCASCATAVIHVPKVAEMLYDIPLKPGWKVGQAFTVLGLVNFDAIPPEQAHIPIDQLDPYPLVPFHAVQTLQKERPPSRRKRPRKPKPKRRK